MSAKFSLTTVILAVLVTLTWQVGTAKGQVITDGLLSFWGFDAVDGTTVKDTIGNRDGTMMGDTIVVEGKFGDGLYFDRDGDYVAFDPTGLPLGNAPRTMSAWVKPEGDGVRAVVEWGVREAAMRCSILLLTADKIKFCGQGQDLGSNGSVPSGEWSQITETYDGEIVRIYLNGEFDIEAAKALNTTLQGATKAGFGRIGANIEVTPGEFMEGSIDGFSISPPRQFLRSDTG